MIWSERPSKILAGIPSARAPGGMTMLLGTTASAPTVAPLHTTAWCRITLHEPASDASSSRQPSRCARCPTTQPSPMIVGKPGAA